MKNQKDWIQLISFRLDPVSVNVISKKGKRGTWEITVPLELLTLMDVFSDKVKFQLVMAILIDKKMVSPYTFAWIDFKKGCKTLMVVIIKRLQFLGYYKTDQPLTPSQIQSICFNTFQMSVGIELIKRVVYDDLLIDYLPPASQIEQLKKGKN